MTTNGGGGSGRPRYYRRKATVEALQWTGDNLQTIKDWFEGEEVSVEDGVLMLRGSTDVQPEQWIVLSPSGRLHICVPGLFEEVHELALADPEDTELNNWAAHAKAQRSAANYWKKLSQRLAKKAKIAIPTPPKDEWQRT